VSDNHAKKKHAKLMKFNNMLGFFRAIRPIITTTMCAEWTKNSTRY